MGRAMKRLLAIVPWLEIALVVTVHGAGSSDGDFRPAIWASTASVT